MRREVQIVRKMQEGAVSVCSERSELRERGLDQAPGGKWATARQARQPLALQVSNGARSRRRKTVQDSRVTCSQGPVPVVNEGSIAIFVI